MASGNSRFVPDDYEEGFSNDDGEENVIDDIMLGDASDTFLKAEQKKLIATDDRFAKMDFGMLDANTKRRVKRQLSKRLTGIAGAKSKQINIEELNGYMLYGLVQPPYNLDNLVELSVENDTHFACIKQKAINIVALGHKWQEKAKVKQARQAVEDDDERMLKLSRKLQSTTDTLDEWIEDLNEDDDLIDTLLKVWWDYESTGNGYIEVGRMRNGEIGYLGHIPSLTIRVRAKHDGFIQMVQNGIGGNSGVTGQGLTFFRNFGDKTTPDYFGKDSQPNEIIQIKKHNSKNQYYGIPDIIAAMTSVAGEKFSGEYNLDYFENKAVPRYALIVKGAKLSASAEKRLLEFFRKEVKGKNHGTLYIPVPAHMGSNVDVKLEAIENKVQEASFEKYREGNRASIAMVHGVPLSKLVGGKGVATAREDDRAFKLQLCKPEQKRLEKKLNRIIKEKTDMYSIKLEEYDLVDAETWSRIHDRYVRIGASSPNEVRAANNEHPRKGGDKFVNMADESAAKVELTLAQAKAATMKSEIPEGGTGPAGPPRKTTDGTPKAKQQTSTPAGDTPQGKGTRGSAQAKGEQTKSTER